MVKRAISVLMAFVLLLTMAACTGGNGEENKAHGEVGSSENVKTNELVFGEFKNFGNDPNNLMQSKYSFAFDEKQIYAVNTVTQDIYSMDFTGGNYKQLLAGATGYRGNLNVYDGYLYYAKENSMKPNVITFERINLTTLENEKIAEKSCEQGKMIEAHFQIIDGYLFYVSWEFIDSSNNYLKIGAIDTATLKEYVITETAVTGVSSIMSATAMCITEYNDHIYAFTWPEDIYRFDLGAFKSSPEQIQVEHLSSGTRLLGYDVLGLNGFRCITKITSEEYVAADYLFDDYQAETKSFKPTNTKNYVFVKSEQCPESLIESTNLSYRVGNSRVFIDLASDKICYYKDSDFTNPQMKNDGNSLYVSMNSGVYKDVLYIMCEDAITGQSVLVVMNSDGTVNQYTIG